MRVTITDKTAERYQAYADEQGRALDAVLEAQLVRFVALPPGKKVIVVAAAEAQAIVGGTPILNGTDLLARVSQLASLSFHHIRLDFSPAQLAELEHRARRQGKSVETLAEEITKAILRDFFWASGGGEAAVSAPSGSASARATGGG